jgi:hypothetical protein
MTDVVHNRSVTSELTIVWWHHHHGAGTSIAHLDGAMLGGGQSQPWWLSEGRCLYGAAPSALTASVEAEMVAYMERKLPGTPWYLIARHMLTLRAYGSSLAPGLERPP